MLHKYSAEAIQMCSVYSLLLLAVPMTFLSSLSSLLLSLSLSTTPLPLPSFKQPTSVFPDSAF